MEISTTLPERLEGKQTKLIINLDKRPSGKLFQGLNHQGYLHSEEVNKWFSAAI